MLVLSFLLLRSIGLPSLFPTLFISHSQSSIMLLSTLVTLCFTLAVTASRLSLCEDKQRSKLVAQYFEAYNDWSVNSIPWRYTDIAFYFQGSTTKSGFQADEYKTTFKQFVEAAHASDTLAIYTIGVF